MPEILLTDLDPMVEAPSSDALVVLETHLENMRRAGMCFASYDALVEAVKSNQDPVE